MLGAVLSLYQTRIQAADLKVICEYKRVQSLICRADDLRQALSSILGNAVDASERGSIIRIRLRQSRDWKTRENVGVRVTIADCGRGIPRENVSHIFEPFFSTKGITNTGLGLFISNNLISKCNGHITVHSSTRKPKSGSAFSVFIPF